MIRNLAQFEIVLAIYISLYWLMVSVVALFSWVNLDEKREFTAKRICFFFFTGSIGLLN